MLLANTTTKVKTPYIIHLPGTISVTYVTLFL